MGLRLGCRLKILDIFFSDTDITVFNVLLCYQFTSYAQIYLNLWKKKKILIANADDF